MAGGRLGPRTSGVSGHQAGGTPKKVFCAISFYRTTLIKSAFLNNVRIPANCMSLNIL